MLIGMGLCIRIKKSVPFTLEHGPTLANHRPAFIDFRRNMEGSVWAESDLCLESCDVVRL